MTYKVVKYSNIFKIIIPKQVLSVNSWIFYKKDALTSFINYNKKFNELQAHFTRKLNSLAMIYRAIQ